MSPVSASDVEAAITDAQVVWGIERGPAVELIALAQTYLAGSLTLGEYQRGQRRIVGGVA